MLEQSDLPVTPGLGIVGQRRPGVLKAPGKFRDLEIPRFLLFILNRWISRDSITEKEPHG